tara:strand:- start:325 stop:636 length:312 start_codon:yes stop_codon:yes gene_type:complete
MVRTFNLKVHQALKKVKRMRNMIIFPSLSTKALVLSPMLKMVNLSTKKQVLNGRPNIMPRQLNQELLFIFIWVGLMKVSIFIIKIGKKFMMKQWFLLQNLPKN